MSYTTMLSQFGVSSAHPGGFAATLEQLKYFAIPKGHKVLEVGCGTGRTASFLAENGYDITAVDQNDDMLLKAKKRATEQGLQVNFVKGNASSLPFADEQFDVIVIESVTNFTDVRTALSEYYRVLKRGGKLYDRELIAVNAIPDEIKAPLFAYFQFNQLLTLEEWLTLLTNNHFTASHWDFKNTLQDNTEHFEHPDEFQYLDQHIFTNMSAFQKAIEYSEILNTYKDYLGSVVIVGVKA